MDTVGKGKRILFINHASGLSGSVISLGHIVEGFVKSGYEVFVVNKNNDKGATYLRESGATVFCTRISIGLSVSAVVEEDLLNPFELFNFLKNFVKVPLGVFCTWYYIRKVRPCLLYLNEFVLPQCSLVGKLMGVQTVMHVRGPILRGRWGIRRRLLVKEVLQWNDRVIAITKTDAEQLIDEAKRGVVPSGERKLAKVYTVHETQHPEESGPADVGSRGKEQFGLKEAVKVVTMLGGVSKIKGTLEFLQAAQCIRELEGETVFVVAGPCSRCFGFPGAKRGSRANEKYAKSVYDFVQEQDISRRVKFLGETRNVKDLLQCTDVLVFPSTVSHFARPVIEAWSFRKPAIMTDTPHAREQIEDGVDGLLVPMNDPQRLADAIRRVLADRELARRMGENGYQKVQRFFNSEENVAKIISICEELIGKGMG
jgi:glycosyltransferase involved in cell wall biosynthesis